MSTLTIGSAGALRRPQGPMAAASLLGRVAHAVAREWRVRRGVRQLRGMDERMLRDIGLGRCDVERAVRSGHP